MLTDCSCAGRRLAGEPATSAMKLLKIVGARRDRRAFIAICNGYMDMTDCVASMIRLLGFAALNPTTCCPSLAVAASMAMMVLVLLIKFIHPPNQINQSDWD